MRTQVKSVLITFSMLGHYSHACFPLKTTLKLILNGRREEEYVKV